ncbi:MAG: hypothetical protein JNL98_32070 [Bryobacterales bacterium]|nr:hypothetical protein [Bryobacterales bacterium]
MPACLAKAGAAYRAGRPERLGPFATAELARKRMLVVAVREVARQVALVAPGLLAHSTASQELGPVVAKRREAARQEPVLVAQAPMFAMSYLPEAAKTRLLPSTWTMALWVEVWPRAQAEQHSPPEAAVPALSCSADSHSHVAALQRRTLDRSN